MSRYHDPEGMGDYPGSGQQRTRPAGQHSTTGGASGQQGWRGFLKVPHRQPGQASASPPRRGYHRFLGSHPILGAAAIISTVLVVGISLVAYASVRNLYDGINHETVTASMLGPRPPKLNGSTNILLIGSDSRAGTTGYGSSSLIQGSRSDTSLILHISPDHTHAYVISFPRDSMVPIYSCANDNEGHPGQSAAPGQLEPLNATFSFGGAPCLWKTLEQTTHIHIDHFAEVGFSSFKLIVNDMHGINVCLPFTIRNYQAHLYLKAGIHKVYGAQALAFVRLRENIGDGSDLERIQRQQIFLAAALQKMKQTNLLGDYKVLADVAHAVTTDLTLTQLLGIANSMRGLNTSSVRFISVPVGQYPPDPNKVLWTQPQADALFKAISHDNHILRAARTATRPGAPRIVNPAQVHLEVLNGSGTAGLAGTTANGLSNAGFVVVGTGDAPSGYGYTRSVIEYSSAAQLPAVNVLRKEVGGAQVKQVTGLHAGTLSLILGSKFTGLPSGSNTKKPKGPSVASVASSNNYQGISGNQNICKDSSAFAGPLSPVPAATP
jgi:LCP family protein required for cell wall assembly